MVGLLRHNADQLLSFHEFDAMIVGGGGMIATSSYVDFHSHNTVLSGAARHKRPVFIASSGAFFPEVMLYSTLLQQATFIAVRDTESIQAIEEYAKATSSLDAVSPKTRMVADLIATAPQRLFSFPSLNFQPLPQPVPEVLSRIVEQLERDNIIGTGNVSVPSGWRTRFPICWILKNGHTAFLKSALELSFGDDDFLMLVGAKEVGIAQQFASNRQIYLYNQNATDFSRFLRDRCRMVVSMALHGTIYAIRLGIPAFGVMAGKIEGALRHFGGEEMVQACSTSSVPPSLAAIVRCHSKYDRTKTLANIETMQDKFTELLRDADRVMLMYRG